MLVKKIGLGVVVGALLATSVTAASPYGSPDITVIGNMVGVIDNDSDGKADTDAELNMSEVDVVLGAQIDNNINAVTRFSFEKQEDSTVDVEIVEAYASFTNLPSMLLGGENNLLDDATFNVGKKLVEFGRVNGQTFEEWGTSSRPYTHAAILGADGLQGEGIEVNVTSPLPMFSAWTIGGFRENGSEADANQVTYDSTVVALRTTETFEVGKGNLDLGLNYLIADDTTVTGLDATYWCKSGAVAAVEYISAEFDNAAGDSTDVSGVVLYVGYDWGNDWVTGLRYGSTEALETTNVLTNQTDDTTEMVVAATRSLSETAKLRFEYSQLAKEISDSSVDTNEFRVQFLFGMGKGASNI